MCAQKLVKLRKGDIRVDSEPGEGSVFKFFLMLPTSGSCGNLDKLSHSMRCQLSELEDKRIKGIKVLLVDANPVRQVWKTTLRPWLPSFSLKLSATLFVR